MVQQTQFHNIITLGILFVNFIPKISSTIPSENQEETGDNQHEVFEKGFPSTKFALHYFLGGKFRYPAEQF